jgi:hypothetical protein
VVLAPLLLLLLLPPYRGEAEGPSSLPSRRE